MNGKRSAAAFAAGLLFAAGLIISGMTQPANVVGFLDFFGDWKPALAFVMAGAVGVYASLYPIVLKRRVPLFAPAFDLPDATGVDARLIVGSAAFGAGWGLGGFCPGPALVALGSGAAEAGVFAAAMGAGVLLHHLAFQSGAPGGEGHNACG
ncbi:MAG: YeeE/YedE family protein [Elusimicrobia bacterium]|nr:YeeE/YedE family protein [Elusimicrobiota bacterium]